MEIQWSCRIQITMHTSARTTPVIRRKIRNPSAGRPDRPRIMGFRRQQRWNCNAEIVLNIQYVRCIHSRKPCVILKSSCSLNCIHYSLCILHLDDLLAIIHESINTNFTCPELNRYLYERLPKGCVQRKISPLYGIPRETVSLSLSDISHESRHEAVRARLWPMWDIKSL